jgi:type I restriction enzyme M protein
VKQVPEELPQSADGITRPAVIVQQGKILDFIDQITQRNETPEEYVRQEIAKSLVREYGYPRNDISVEFTIRLGTRKPRADIIIFGHGKKHSIDDAEIIVECKSPKTKSTDRGDGVEQLKSYMRACPRVAYGMWTNGLERYCYKRNLGADDDREPFDVPDIPAFGQPEEDADRPRFDQLKPASSDALLFAFRRCHNYIAGNQGLQKPEAFWELLKLIFCKVQDERHSDIVQFYVAGSERRGLNGQLKVKERIDKLFRAVREDYTQIFKKTDEIELNPPVLQYIVSQLQMYSLLDSDVDVKGKAYEEIVGSNLRGDRGEFFTPRNVCAMAVGMLNPDEETLILDPACGTGGFLITAMNHVFAKIYDAELVKRGGDRDRAEAATRERGARFLKNKIFGLDLNPNLVKAAKMNMVMNNDGSGGLWQANSLAAPASWDSPEARKILGKVDLLFTNPPFGSKIPVDDHAILESYELGHSWTYVPADDTWVMSGGLRSQPPEILFIERCVQFLKPGTGRAAIVVPDGILGTPGLGYVRQWLLKHTRILASIDMHPDTFAPSTSVQTSILVFQRKSAQEIALEEAAGQQNDYDIFMALGNHIGHDKRGNELYVRDPEGNEIVEEHEKTVREYVDGRRVQSTVLTLQKVRDDNTQQVVKAFRAWLLPTFS